MINTQTEADLRRLIKGRVKLSENLANHTSFRIGGPACVWAEPADEKSLRNILKFAKRKVIKVFIMGGGTNLLVADEGFNGIVIHLGAKDFKEIRTDGDSVRVGAGCRISRLIRFCCERGLGGGIESLVGIPGTVGGAVYMNAGGASNPIYKNIGDYIVSLKVMDYSGNIKNLKKEILKFGYRSSNLSPYIILEASLKLEEERRDVLSSRCAGFLKMKRKKQTLDMPSAGCIFKNPEDFQFTCGQMIDMLGLKGRRIGGAQISERHANFIVNRGDASFKDVLRLIEFVRSKIKENYKIPLELEIQILN